MARLSFEYCRFCEIKTNWVDSRCTKCGNGWWTVQEAITERERQRKLNSRATATGRLAADVDFVTMKPFKKRKS